MSKALAARSMRIIALPLTRPAARARPAGPGGADVGTMLTYFHFQTAPAPAPAKSTTRQGWLPEEGVVNWATGKAGSIWAGFGKADEGTWKLRVFQTGERLVDRMEFEELSLKGVDPSLGPSVAHPDVDGPSPPPLSVVPLLHPPAILGAELAITQLRTLLSHRTPRHRRGAIAWAVVAPLTAPFMIIPIIPNLPFFFCVWRAWSHYRAFRASQYLEALLERGAIAPSESTELDKVYAEHAPSPPKTTDSEDPGSRLLLTRSAVPRILALFGLGDAPGADVYRAVEQARARVLAGRA